MGAVISADFGGAARKPLNYQVFNLAEQRSSFVDRTVIEGGGNDRHFPLMAIYAGKEGDRLGNKYEPIPFVLTADEITPLAAIEARKFPIDMFVRLVTESVYEFTVTQTAAGYQATMIDPFIRADLNAPGVVAYDTVDAFIRQFNAGKPWPIEANASDFKPNP